MPKQSFKKSAAKKGTPRLLGLKLLAEARAKTPDFRHMVRLINAGAALELRDKDGDTPLLAATRRGHVNAAILLLNSGANPGAEDNDRRAPLYHAINRRDLDIIKPLLAVNAPTGFITNSLVGQDRWDDYIYSLEEAIRNRDAGITRFPVMKKLSLRKR